MRDCKGNITQNVVKIISNMQWLQNHLLLDFVKMSVKGIFRDPNNIFLWHESEDKNKQQQQKPNKNKKQKTYFQNFSWIHFFRFEVMHDYVCFIAPIDYCVE